MNIMPLEDRPTLHFLFPTLNNYNITETQVSGARGTVAPLI
jgi:hypothetical protein